MVKQFLFKEKRNIEELSTLTIMNKTITKKKKFYERISAYPIFKIGQLNVEKKRYNKYNLSDLKEMMNKNSQNIEGNKSEILERISEGIIFGRIPKCINCSENSLKFSKKIGSYICFKEKINSCLDKFKPNEVERLRWID